MGNMVRPNKGINSMKRTRSIGLILTLSLLPLASCDLPDGRICGASPPSTDLVDVGDVSKGMLSNRDRAKNCVNRWAYRLAKSGDNAKIVAEAVVAACRNDILAANVEQEKFVLAHYEQDALFFVVQARAGRCKVI
ncbi:MAG: hypothetical protein O9286_08440 [Aquidulcibacter sp.]|uniref:hypothetical protein n=1 Tax=Aquidulcibacter sp. TaxID=2052990 RepID=UPI0022CA58C3|nr:hypothetical protein [Aquidulcibacter sp.]